MTDRPQVSNRTQKLGRSLSCLLLLAAFALFTFVYQPNRRRADHLTHEVNHLRRRVSRLRAAAHRLETRCAALRAQDREVLSEAIRETLHKGRRGEYVLEE